MFIDYLAKDSATFRCATKGTYCSFKACNFSIPNFTAHSRPQSQTIVGSVNEASVTVENVDAFPGPAAVWVDTPQNMRNAFYTDEGLTVISKGKAVSETQPLDEISDKRAQRFIAVEDEWFQSLQRVSFPCAVILIVRKHLQRCLRIERSAWLTCFGAASGSQLGRQENIFRKVSIHSDRCACTRKRPPSIWSSD